MFRTPWLSVALVVALPLAACDDPLPEPQPARSRRPPRSAGHSFPPARSPRSSVSSRPRRGIVPLAAPPPVRPALARLGQALAFDQDPQRQQDIACTTCHLPAFATGDGRSLSVGQGATGLGPARVHPTGVFIPRNAPPLFNLSAMRHLFWDGRVAVDAAGNFSTPAGAQLTPAMTRVFEFGPVSALGMFPVTNRAEMRSGTGNELALIADDDFQGIWSALMKRLGAIGEYRGLFEAAYPGTRFDDMTFAHASNAIAGFFVDSSRRGTRRGIASSPATTPRSRCSSSTARRPFSR